MLFTHFFSTVSDNIVSSCCTGWLRCCRSGEQDTAQPHPTVTTDWFLQHSTGASSCQQEEEREGRRRIRRSSRIRRSRRSRTEARLSGLAGSAGPQRYVLLHSEPVRVCGFMLFFNPRSVHFNTCLCP